MRRVDDAVALELYPDAIGARSRKHHIELNLRTAIRNEGVGVHHVDEIVAGCQHVSPGAEVFFESFRR